MSGNKSDDKVSSWFMGCIMAVVIGALLLGFFLGLGVGETMDNEIPEDAQEIIHVPPNRWRIVRESTSMVPGTHAVYVRADYMEVTKSGALVFFVRGGTYYEGGNDRIVYSTAGWGDVVLVDEHGETRYVEHDPPR